MLTGNNHLMAETVFPRVYGVAEINYYLKQYLAEDLFLGQLAIRGEISGYKAHSSGHIYFTLKEQDSSIRSVMFRRYAGRLSFTPHDGEEVVVIGAVSLYERDGSCQIYVEEIFPAGGGAQARALAELKERLAEEGLFAEERKKPLLRFAFNIGVVTSGEGAAWADIQRIAYARNPQVQLQLYPALVQGDAASESIAAAIAKADLGGHDILIVGRGGGAEADLAAFDTELVVRAVAAAQTPIISAVGHESDFSLCDLAADLRAATPTHAAQMAVTDLIDTLAKITGLTERLTAGVQRLLRGFKQRIDAADPAQSMLAALSQYERQLLIESARLEAFNPQATLKRGFALVEKNDGSLVRCPQEVQAGERIMIHTAQGTFRAIVEDNDNG